jgi:hypothetical protein
MMKGRNYDAHYALVYSPQSLPSSYVQTVGIIVAKENLNIRKIHALVLLAAP